MIELRTGVPGSGKTLSAVWELKKLLDRWGKHPEEARPIFVHGVKDLALPHAVMPVISTPDPRTGQAVLTPDWAAMPDGAFVLIDEAQTLFPPRSTQSTPPPHVAWLNTHRHRGFDLVVITQHPKLVDGSLRALVGKHKHYRRLFGGQRSMVYEWDSCSDSLAGLRNAVTSYWGYPREAFACYKSAEVHTKQSFRYPLWLALPVLALIIGAVAVPKAIGTLSDGISGQGLTSATKPPTAASAAPRAPSGATTPAAPPSAPVQTAAAPAAPASAAEPKPPPIAGCLAMARRCICVDAQGALASVPEAACKAASVELGGLIPYDTTSRPVQASWRPSLPP